MVLKTFSVQQEVFDKFSGFCKERGLSMSKQVEFFMQSIAEKEPNVKKAYLQKLERIRKGKFVKVDDFAGHYGLK